MRNFFATSTEMPENDNTPDPATAIDDPVLKICYAVLLVLFLVGINLQLRWIHRQRKRLLPMS
jgi:hypothetical protein